MSLGIIILILLVLMFLGVAPTWSHSRSWKYAQSGLLGTISVINWTMNGIFTVIPKANLFLL